MLEFNGKPVTLKYLFVARFADGKIYEQNEQDISVLNPEKSCFFDVLQEDAKNPVTNFAITDGKQVWALDLQTCTFNVGNSEFQLHDDGQPFYNKRLIFFRRRCQDMISGQELSCHYVVGWQGNVAENPESECKKFVISVK
jgi:hypothetical protein